MLASVQGSASLIRNKIMGVAQYPRRATDRYLTQHTCTTCGTVFSDSQFCPECGAWADPLDDELVEEFTLDDRTSYDEDLVEVPVVSSTAYISCPSCGAANPSQNRHCEECGARLSQEELPVAAPPMLRTSAGARALVAVIVVIAMVAVAAFIFQAFGPDEDPVAGDTTIATSTTSQPPARARQITPLEVTASSSLSERWAPENLTDRDPITVWNDASQGGQGAWIEFTFAQPIEIQWINIAQYEEDHDFYRNFRIRGYLIIADDLRDQPVPGELEDVPGDQRVAFQSVRTTSLRFEVVSTWPAQAFDGEVPYEELAVQEFEFWGRDAQPLGTEG